MSPSATSAFLMGSGASRACAPTRVTKKVADLPSQNFWLGGNYLNYYYHPVRAPPRDKQSCSLCGIDIISLLIHSCSILCLNISKMRCFVCFLSQCGSLHSDENLRSFRQAKFFGGRSLPLFLSTAWMSIGSYVVRLRLGSLATQHL